MPSKRTHLLDGLSRSADRLSRALIALMMAIMVADVLVGVGNRFVFKFSISWTEQLARFLLIWISMLGAAIAVRAGGHIGISFVAARLGRFRQWCMLINALLVIVFLIIVGAYGIKLCISQSRQFSPVMRISMFWPYLAIPFGCALMILHYLAALKSPQTIFQGEHSSSEEERS